MGVGSYVRVVELIIAIKHNLIQFKLKGDDLPPPAAEIRREFDITLCAELLLVLLDKSVVPILLQAESYVLLEGLDVGVGELFQCELAGSRGR